jgi:hypothetical protein
MDGQEKTVDEKLKEMSTAVGTFQDRLGLTFKKTSGSFLVFADFKKKI